MPDPELIYRPEDYEKFKQYQQYYWQQRKIYQQDMEKGDDEDPLLTFAKLLAAQMLGDSPTMAALKKAEKDGKTPYVYRANDPESILLDLADETLQDPYFQIWTENKSPEDLRQAAKDPTKALMDLRGAYRWKKHYDDLGKRSAKAKADGGVSGVQKEAKSYYEAMQATGTGRNWLGVKRKSNSREYEAMMEAMGKAVNDGPKNQTPEQRAQNLAEAVAATKKYLADKKTVRKTEDGAIRWENSMKFLYSAMPAKEFKAYCDEVNQAREEKDQIDPEQFAPARTPEHTVQAVQQEIRDKGEITLQDAAKVAAAYDLSKLSDVIDERIEEDGRWVGILGPRKPDPDQFKTQEFRPDHLAQRTAEIAANKKFQKWFRAQGKDVLKDDMTKGHDGLGARIGHWSRPRPQDRQLTKQLEAREQEKIRRQEEERRKEQEEEAERQVYLDRQKESDPTFYEILRRRRDSIERIKKEDPDAYKQQKADFDKTMKDLIAANRELEELKKRKKLEDLEEQKVPGIG